MSRSTGCVPSPVLLHGLVAGRAALIALGPALLIGTRLLEEQTERHDGGNKWKPINSCVAEYVGAPKESDVGT